MELLRLHITEHHASKQVAIAVYNSQQDLVKHTAFSYRDAVLAGENVSDVIRAETIHFLQSLTRDIANRKIL
jgi:hypothetical protein